MVESSVHPSLMDEATDIAMSSMERAKTEPKRSPSCMPVSDIMTSLPKINSPGLAYAETA